MALNPEVDGIVELPVPVHAVEAGNGHVAEEPAVEVVAVAEPKPRRARPAWVVPASIAAIGLVVAGSLGFVLYLTIQQRDALHTQLVSTRGTLASTQLQLTAAQADAAQEKVTADYVAMYVNDSGKVQTDYQSTIVCNSYSECRTAAQQMLTDLQAFQADRKSANVPFALESPDSSLGDALSSAIAGIQEAIGGMDSDSQAKVDDGYTKVNAAMLNVAKAESVMGTQLK